jgi:hypothetical protein
MTRVDTTVSSEPDRKRSVVAVGLLAGIMSLGLVLVLSFRAHGPSHAERERTWIHTLAVGGPMLAPTAQRFEAHVSGYRIEITVDVPTSPGAAAALSEAVRRRAHSLATCCRWWHDTTTLFARVVNRGVSLTASDFHEPDLAAASRHALYDLDVAWDAPFDATIAIAFGPG